MAHVRRNRRAPTATAVLAFATFTLALGALEGTAAGCAQSLVIRERLSGFEGWVQASVAGALVAWILGMITHRHKFDAS